jgi:hypothetical protein
MVPTTMAGIASVPTLPGGGVLRYIRFTPQAGPGDEVLAEFRDPTSHKAVCVASAVDRHECLEVLTVAGQVTEDPSRSDELSRWVAEGACAGVAPTVVTVHGAQIVWSPRRAAILATPDRVSLFLLALVDFWYYESELRKLEAEISASWSQLEEDMPLAHSVTRADPERFEDVGRRTEDALKRRTRLARLVPHLYQPRPHLPLLANQLVDRLRERTHVETRHEALVTQLDVFDRVYEMSSQRISDFTAARKSHTLEWIIIVLLAAESLLLLIEVLWMLEK